MSFVLVLVAVIFCLPLLYQALGSKDPFRETCCRCRRLAWRRFWGFLYFDLIVLCLLVFTQGEYLVYPVCFKCH